MAVRVAPPTPGQRIPLTPSSKIRPRTPTRGRPDRGPLCACALLLRAAVEIAESGRAGGGRIRRIAIADRREAAHLRRTVCRRGRSTAIRHALRGLIARGYG